MPNNPSESLNVKDLIEKKELKDTWIVKINVLMIMKSQKIVKIKYNSKETIICRKCPLFNKSRIFIFQGHQINKKVFIIEIS